MGYFDRPRNSMFGYGYGQAPPIPPRRTVIPVRQAKPRKVVYRKPVSITKVLLSREKQPKKVYDLSGKMAGFARQTGKDFKGARENISKAELKAEAYASRSGERYRNYKGAGHLYQEEPSKVERVRYAVTGKVKKQNLYSGGVKEKLARFFGKKRE